MSFLRYFPTMILLLGVVYLSVAFAAPLSSPARSIVDSVLYPNMRFFNELASISSRELTPSVSQAAGIQRSRLGYAQTSGSVVGLTIPATGVTRGTANMSGSISLRGRLASDIEDLTELLVQNYSQELQDFYRREKESLQTRASGGYFFFFQAAANYGYSDEQETRRVLADAEFQSFADAARGLLSTEGDTALEGQFRTDFEYRSEGRRETLTIFGWVYVNQITLDSGEIFNVVKRNSDLVMADDQGNVRQENPGAVEFRNINDSTIDTNLSSA
eukprot:TRINITY_DN5412_c0_g1_i1.p1 TRINITY_DN5412_c0_g1~~TRINITY_DN5412_c0_g1_i1.p1  ORF type:complete len:274 (-),score=37.59 TRINITY_DN5412_c0_g1_i1:272-1093(-)